MEVFLYRRPKRFLIELRPRYDLRLYMAHEKTRGFIYSHLMIKIRTGKVQKLATSPVMTTITRVTERVKIGLHDTIAKEALGKAPVITMHSLESIFEILRFDSIRLTVTERDLLDVSGRYELEMIRIRLSTSRLLHVGSNVSFLMHPRRSQINKSLHVSTRHIRSCFFFGSIGDCVEDTVGHVLAAEIGISCTIWESRLNSLPEALCGLLLVSVGDEDMEMGIVPS